MKFSDFSIHNLLPLFYLFGIWVHWRLYMIWIDRSKEIDFPVCILPTIFFDVNADALFRLLILILAFFGRWMELQFLISIFLNNFLHFFDIQGSFKVSLFLETCLLVLKFHFYYWDSLKGLHTWSLIWYFMPLRYSASLNFIQVEICVFNLRRLARSPLWWCIKSCFLWFS